MSLLQTAAAGKLGTMIVRYVSHFDVKATSKCNTASDDIKNSDPSKIHNLSRPVAVEGAEPGDCLVIDILDGMYAGFS